VEPSLQVEHVEIGIREDWILEMSRVTDERAMWLGRHVLPHEAALRSWLGSKRLNGIEIDDIVQETYTRLISVASVDHIVQPRAYTFQTAHSVLVSQLRRSKVVALTTVSDVEMLGIAADEPSPEHHVADREEFERLGRAIATLPRQTQAVFRLRRVEGLSQREVAGQLGIAESTVEKHMSRGFMLMLELFQRGGLFTVSGKTTGGQKLRERHD
jgi:RNA polymerase sigma-70 factor (ECF subfamily)